MIRKLLLAAAALVPTLAHAQVEQAQTVPGFADFLAVDGDAVWATNRGKVEKWSRTGKLAEVAVASPCGALTVAFGSLWVANCADGSLVRFDEVHEDEATAARDAYRDQTGRTMAEGSAVFSVETIAPVLRTPR